MNVVILQPSYIPWRGYFDQIRKADVFVFYDCVQYDKHGWRNRNKIKTSQGPQWLTIPVNAKGCVTSSLAIRDVPVVWDACWTEKHFKSIDQNYRRAPFHSVYMPLLEEIYSRRDKLLADFTCSTTEVIARNLGINHTQFIRSSGFVTKGTKTDRLVEILKQVGATHYISGPSASSYLEADKLADIGVSVEFMDYNYPEYPQIHGPFEPQVTILDLMLNVGPDAAKYIWQ